MDSNNQVLIRILVDHFYFCLRSANLEPIYDSAHISPRSHNMPLLHCRNNCPTNNFRLSAGISSMVNEAELEAMASQPTSSHIIRAGSACKLAQYTEIVMSHMTDTRKSLHFVLSR